MISTRSAAEDYLQSRYVVLRDHQVRKERERKLQLRASSNKSLGLSSSSSSSTTTTPHHSPSLHNTSRRTLLASGELDAASKKRLLAQLAKKKQLEEDKAKRITQRPLKRPASFQRKIKEQQERKKQKLLDAQRKQINTAGALATTTSSGGKSSLPLPVLKAPDDHADDEQYVMADDTHTNDEYAATLFVGDLAPDVAHDSMLGLLRQHFAQFGRIEHIQLLTRKCYGFITFSLVEEATKALESLNGHVPFAGSPPFRVARAKRPGKVASPTSADQVTSANPLAHNRAGVNTMHRHHHTSNEHPPSNPTQPTVPTTPATVVPHQPLVAPNYEALMRSRPRDICGYDDLI